jgi:hypothetical protein
MVKDGALLQPDGGRRAAHPNEGVPRSVGGMQARSLVPVRQQANGDRCSFVPQEPRIWNGRYARVPGEQTAFHVRRRDNGWRPFAVWIEREEIASCPMVDCDAASDIARAVNRGKRLLGVPAGGSFVINEFGQVLVPSSAGDGQVALVGEWQGVLRFTDMLHGGTFDLVADKLLASGDRWERPYLGIPYHLSFRSEIYFWKQDSRGTSKELPSVQDSDLIDALRALRPSGAVRFVVCCGGLVLTKAPVASQWRRWEARYVGRIDYSRWFSKEI